MIGIIARPLRCRGLVFRCVGSGYVYPSVGRIRGRYGACGDKPRQSLRFDGVSNPKPSKGSRG